MSGGRPPVRKSLGQNFLHDPSVIHRIISAIAPREDDRMVEVGPGHGALTIPLLEHLRELHVVEYDRALVPLLRDFPGGDRLVIHEADAVKFDFATLGHKLRIVGNLPYQISSPLLFNLTALHDQLLDMTFMLQREVVDRITASPGNGTYGRLTVMLAAWFDARKLFDVGPGAFKPPPKVHSSIVQLAPRAGGPLQIGDQTIWETVVRQAFSTRRKTLRNCLKTVANVAQLEAAGMDPGARAETIDPATFARLSLQLSQT